MDAQEWNRKVGDEAFVISTARQLISGDFVNEAFSTPEIYWSHPMTAENLKLMLDNSCTFGLYTSSADTDAPTQIGMARIITDYCTFAYLTDVYIKNEHQGKGLGKWLMRCVGEFVDAMPELRRLVLLARDDDASMRLYTQQLKVELMEQRENGTVFLTRQKMPFKASRHAKRDNEALPRENGK
jgi:GNAT superfamily N-acetyltransferase